MAWEVEIVLIRSRISRISSCARAMSWSSCKPTQNASFNPKNRDRRSPVSAVIPRLPEMISPIRR